MELSPEAIAHSCSRILLSLPGPEEVRAVASQLELCAAPGSAILDTTTGDPILVEQLAARMARQGVSWLDAEIGGSSRQTAEGNSIVLCGGTPEAFEQNRDILDAISPGVFRTGPVGTGTRMKLALNIAIGLHRAVLAESLSFARANGIDAKLALEIFKAGPAYSRAMDVKGHKMLTGDFTPEARLLQHLKDVRIIRAVGNQTGARLPLSAVHEQLLTEAVERGLGDQDNSAIAQLFAGTTE